MFFNPRSESAELKLLRYLNPRMNFSEKEKWHFLNLEKGYEGELKFDMLLENLLGEWIILSDLLLEVSNTVFQIDSLPISQNSIFLLDVKNYEGDFYIEADRWYMASGKEIKNPLLQLRRSESLLRRFLQDHNFNFSIKAYLIFINPEFTLYEAPRDLPIIYPTQLNRFMENLNKSTSKLNAKHSKFAELLVSKDMNESSFTQLPNYDYEHLRKGVNCKCCQSFLVSFEKNKLVCDSCGCKEEIKSAIFRSVKELTLLFPGRIITTNAVHEWCEAIVSKKTIERVLMKNYKRMGHGRSSHYVNSSDS